MEQIISALHRVSPLQVYELVQGMTTTELVFAFLVSKAVFVAFAAIGMFTPVRTSLSRALSGKDTEPGSLWTAQH